MTVFKQGETLDEMREQLQAAIPSVLEFGSTIGSGNSFEINIINFDSLPPGQQDIILRELEERGFATPAKNNAQQGLKRGFAQALRTRDLTLQEISEFLRSEFTIDSPGEAPP